MTLWFPEAYRWSSGTTWLRLLNPLSTSQSVTVTLLGPGITRTVTIPARSPYGSQELGSWGASGDFSVEVRCDSLCVASLTMWDRQMATAHESIPIVGCEAR